MQRRNPNDVFTHPRALGDIDMSWPPPPPPLLPSDTLLAASGTDDVSLMWRDQGPNDHDPAYTGARYSQATFGYDSATHVSYVCPRCDERFRERERFTEHQEVCRVSREVTPVPREKNEGGASDVEKALLHGLGVTLENEGFRATFTCGGRIPIITDPNRTTSGDLTPRTGLRVSEQQVTVEPVSIRWGENGTGRIVSLPVTSPSSEDLLSGLIQDCVPATFGRGGEDVYDESYRRAGALGAQDFMTNFCPYKSGIIDIITQLLLPPIVGDLIPQDESIVTVPDLNPETFDAKVSRILNGYVVQLPNGNTGIPNRYIRECLTELGIPPGYSDGRDDLEASIWKFDPQLSGWVQYLDLFDLAKERVEARLLHDVPKAAAKAAEMLQATLARLDRAKNMMYRGIRAELYKLNAYSGPSGMFKAHVDTPRSETQIGSLVVALPVAFQGGALAVRHHEQEVLYDWASGINESEPAISWAAFYSDCEHEILEVTAGHRLTLTYNLYLTPGTGLLSGRTTSLQKRELPLAQQLTGMLTNPDFKPRGGYIGFYLAHSYPHTHRTLHHFIPSMLKGVDMMLYSAILAADLTCVLEPIQDGRLGNPNVLEELDAERPPVSMAQNDLQPFEADLSGPHEGTNCTRSDVNECEMYSSDLDDVEDEEGKAQGHEEIPDEIWEVVGQLKEMKRISWLNAEAMEKLQEPSKAWMAVSVPYHPSFHRVAVSFWCANLYRSMATRRSWRSGTRAWHSLPGYLLGWRGKRRPGASSVVFSKPMGPSRHPG